MSRRSGAGDPFKARGRSLLLLATEGVAVLGTTVLSTLGASSASALGPALKVLVQVASVAVNAGVFVFAFRIATARDLPVCDVAYTSQAEAQRSKGFHDSDVTYNQPDEPDD